MKSLSLSIFAVFQILFLQSVLVCGQTVEAVKFTDGSELKIPVNHIADEKLSTEKITSFKVLKKEAVFIYDSGNKAGYSILPGKLTKKILAAHRTLFKKIDGVTTSYSLEQNGQSFSIDGFDSVNLKLMNACGKCRVKAIIHLLEIKLSDATYYIPFIESFKILEG